MIKIIQDYTFLEFCKNAIFWLILAVIVNAVIFTMQQLVNYFKRLLNYIPFKVKKVKVVETLEDCQDVLKTLKSHCKSYSVLGFDCEWITVGGTRRPISLLQLSSQRGLCALFRLCCLHHIPKELRDILEDEEIVKVGVAPGGDAKHLAYDYGIGVASTFDLRFLAAMTGYHPGGLAKLSKLILDKHLNKSWRLVCSNWEAQQLSDAQIEYAANDALVALAIFDKLSKILISHKFGKTDVDLIKSKLRAFMDLDFKHHIIKDLKNLDVGNTVELRSVADSSLRKTKIRHFSTRTKTLYDNCFLQAPDGELLAMIDGSKARWYLDQNLATEVKLDPLTVRLNFEPAGRVVGEEERYYQLPKENKCVVCGRNDAYIRKNVVPHEYRTHFPVVMKSHSSHDILLLCPYCHRLSNIADVKVRNKLNRMCDDNSKSTESTKKFTEMPQLKKVKSAARALLNYSDRIPQAKCDQLKNVILSYYTSEKEISVELLQKAAALESSVYNENYREHGEKVVKKFQKDFGGLLELEKLWRQHFIDTMQPKFLPTGWSINHNASRLERKINEGRINDEEVIAAIGLKVVDKTLDTESTPEALSDNAENIQ